jgi:hypothetical protein
MAVLLKAKNWASYRPDQIVLVSLAIFLIARIGLSALAATLWQAGWVSPTANTVFWPQPGMPSPTEGLYGMLVGIWRRFDVEYYTVIAWQGYFREQLSVFLPFYPFLIWVGSLFLGGDTLLSGFVISNLACFLFLIVFMRLMIYEGNSNSAAYQAALYIVIFPTSIFLFIPYSESVFILLSTLAFYDMRQKRWWLASLWILLAAITRIQGWWLIAALVIELCLNVGWNIRKWNWKTWSVIAIPAVAVAGIFLWREMAGFGAFTDVQREYWNNRVAFPHEVIFLTLQRIFSGAALPIDYINLLITIITAVLGVWVARRLPLSYSIYYWASFIFTLFRMRNGLPLADEARYCLSLFPMFMILPAALSSPWARRIWLIISTALCLFIATIYILGGFVG